MARKVVVITNPDGTKKVIVGKPTEGNIVKSRIGDDKRPKPIMGKAGLTKTKTAYRKGGKIKC